MSVITISRDHRPEEASDDKGREIILAPTRQRCMGDTKLASSPTKPYLSFIGWRRNLRTPIRCDIIPSTERPRRRQNFNTPDLMPDYQLQTPTYRRSSMKGPWFGAGWRIFILITVDAPTSKAQNSNTLHVLVIWFEVSPPSNCCNVQEGRGTSDDSADNRGLLDRFLDHPSREP
jgi:hypothetical protein